MAPVIPICKLLIYPKPSRHEKDCPQWELVPKNPKTDLRYGRARFLEPVCTVKGNRTYIFHAWSKPEDLLDVHREAEDGTTGKGAEGAIIVQYNVGHEYGRKLRSLDKVLRDGFAALEASKGEEIDQKKMSGLFFARSVLDYFAGQNAYPYCGYSIQQAGYVRQGMAYPAALKKIFENIEKGRDLAYGATPRNTEKEMTEAEETNKQIQLREDKKYKGWEKYEKLAAEMNASVKAEAATTSVKRKRAPSKRIDKDMKPLVFVEERLSGIDRLEQLKSNVSYGETSIHKRYSQMHTTRRQRRQGSAEERLIV